MIIGSLSFLDGVHKSKGEHPFLVIGNHTSKFGKYLINKFKGCSSIKFLSGIYNIEKLNNLRHYSNLYFHGHTVGGTNPSLLEAMASNALICANNNVYNKAILGPDAFYFTNSEQVCQLLLTVKKDSYDNRNKIHNNVQKIGTTYGWPNIVQQYVTHFQTISMVN